MDKYKQTEAGFSPYWFLKIRWLEQTVFHLSLNRRQVQNSSERWSLTKDKMNKTILSKWAIPCLFFFIFVLSTVNSICVYYTNLPMTGFELTFSVFINNNSANRATTTKLSYSV